MFLAAPSDVTEEHDIIGGVLGDWNVQHGQALEARVELVSWRTHSFPATGKRPQALINKQAFDTSDIVVGVFWSRFGSPTGIAESGTEEEIRRGIARRKKVLVYFSKRSMKNRNPMEHSKIERFRREFGQQGLFWVYTDLGSFESAFRNHLAAVMHELLKRRQRK